MQSIMWDSTLQSIGDEPSPIGEEEYNARQRRLFSQLRPGDLLIVTAPHESTRSNDVHYHCSQFPESPGHKNEWRDE